MSTTRPLALILNPDGTPNLCQLGMRMSESAPARVKVNIVSEVDEDAKVLQAIGDDSQIAPWKGPKGTVGLGNEFRLEMN